MARVLLVDDEAEHRQTVADVVRALGHEVVEACCGNEGVDKVGLGGYGLAVIDHAMPDLGGAAVVEAMRVQGDRTPVIMLLSDFKRATLAVLMKLGVADMVTKPLRSAELEEKIGKLLGRGDSATTPEPVAPPAPAPVSAPAPAQAQAPAQRPISRPADAATRPTPPHSTPVTSARGSLSSPPVALPGRAGSLSSTPAAPPVRAGSLSSTPAAAPVRAGSLSSTPAAAPVRPTSLPATPAVAVSASALPAVSDEPADAKVLIVDHMDAVRRALAALIPEGLGVHTCRNIGDAQLKMRAHSYRLIFFDADLPVNGLPGLIDQFRLQQKEAVFVGVEIAKETGEPEHKDSLVFDDMVTRPFDETLIAEVADQFTGSFQRVVSLEGEDLLRIATFRGRRPRLDAYLEHLDRRLQQHLHGLAEACVDSVLVDVTCLPQAHAPRAARFVADLLAKQAALGLKLRLVAAAPLQEALRTLPETRDLRTFFTVEEARAAG
jgi:DNA-binding response OmpR family regulator